MRSKSILHYFLWTITFLMILRPDLKGQNSTGSMEILVEYPDSSWKASGLVIETGTFRYDLKEFQPDENGRAYMKILLDKPAFATLEMLGKSYSVKLFLWPGDLLHIKFTNSPETETISHVDFQGQTRNIQKFFYEYQKSGLRINYAYPIDPLNPGNSKQDSISINAWMVEYYEATEPDVYFLDMYKANMFAQKWLSIQKFEKNPLYSKDTLSFTFPDEVVSKTRILYEKYPQLTSISNLSAKMGFGKFEEFLIPEMINCTDLRQAQNYSLTFQVRARLESSSRGINPRKMTAKEVDFIRDCLFLLKDTESYEEDLEKAIKSMYAGLPDASATVELDNIEPNSTLLDYTPGNDSLIIILLYDYHTEDSIFQKPTWLDAYQLQWVAVSLDYSSEKWEEGKSRVPQNIPSLHLKNGIMHPAAKAYQWYQYPRLVLYNSKSRRVIEHIMPQYEREDLWEEILSGVR